MTGRCGGYNDYDDDVHQLKDSNGRYEMKWNELKLKMNMIARAIGEM